MIEVTGLLVLIVVVGTYLAYLESPLRRGARYSGRIYDPQPRPYRRAGAVGWTGVKCPLCGATTFGNSPRCGACGRMNVSPRIAPVEKSAFPPSSRPSLLASEAAPPFSASPVTTARHDQAATAHHVNPTSLSPVSAPASRGTRRRRGRSSDRDR